MPVSPFRAGLIADIRLEQAVRRELLVDSRAGDAQEVAISAEEGCVTLSGTVDTFQQKRAIGKVAARVVGVTGVVAGCGLDGGQATGGRTTARNAQPCCKR